MTRQMIEKPFARLADLKAWLRLKCDRAIPWFRSELFTWQLFDHE